MMIVVTPLTVAERRRLAERETLILELLRPTGAQMQQLADGYYLVGGRYEVHTLMGYWSDRRTGKQGFGIASLRRQMTAEPAPDPGCAECRPAPMPT